MISTIQAENDKTVPYGLLIAVSILVIWAISFSLLLSVSVDQWSRGMIACAVIWQTFVYTGLFITAHDAMHGSILPSNLKINHLIGTISVTVYALFSYKKLLQKHWQHHRHPASDQDPDFHNGRHRNIVLWYLHFMKGYMNWQQIISLVSVYYLINWVVGIPEDNLFLFWIVPSFISSLQLFFFGTFLPHREPSDGYTNRHRAKTYPLPVFWSFLSCYHFGYHEEHHEYPHVPWWQLPVIHKQLQAVATPTPYQDV
ncbi:MAG TPA: fatty acid desaturase [Trichocoleus sp.]